MTADLNNFHIAMICIAYRMGWAMDGKTRLKATPHTHKRLYPVCSYRAVGSSPGVGRLIRVVAAD